MIKQYINSYWRLFLFWMVFFTIFRLIFVVFNLSYSHDATLPSVLEAFFIGLRLDSSFTGYIMGLVVLLQIISLIVSGRICLKCINYLSYFQIAFLSLVLLSDINLFSYWGKHIDLEALGFIQMPDIILASLKWYEVPLFLMACIISISGFIFAYNKFVMIKPAISETSYKIKKAAITLVVVLFSGVLLIIPVRGSFGVAPINTGVAYFSSYRFANQTAINPLWNLAYDLKKMGTNNVEYRYMDDELANQIFDELTAHSGTFDKLLNTERPNVVVILLESFAAHVISDLGGEAITPHIDSLINESVLFSNIRAAANRSDKGLVAALAGYQVLPSYSIIRFPEKTASLSFLPQKLKDNGYKDLMYLYGGDIKFKNMNSFVRQAGFDQVISIDDFDMQYRGEKWGVHDEYTFARLIDNMEASKEPYFKFLFTLSSHEPFDVPMDRVFENDYYNSIAYTDKCIGDFFRMVKKKNMWDNTLFILIADHSVPGPNNIPLSERNYAHIPMIWTGGALSVKDTTISHYGSQTDLARTLLSQLDIDAEEFQFSKNILDKEVEKFAFNIIAPSGVSFIDSSGFQFYDVKINRFITFEGRQTTQDSLKAKAYLQVLYNDSKKR